MFKVIAKTLTVLAVAAAALLVMTRCENCLDEPHNQPGDNPMSRNEFEVQKSEQQWREELTPQQYNICREKGTEPAFSGEYWDKKDSGTYLCAACGQELYASDTKFDSGSGWPSFYAPIEERRIATDTDTRHGMQRTEIMCGRCGAHLGHVFDDGPAPTGMRHCVNSASLKFRPRE